MTRALLGCAVLLMTAGVRAGDWPQFRGPGGTAVSDEKGLPVKWGPAEGVRWKADLPGRGVSSPVVAAGRVYVTASAAYRQGRLHVLCFDAASGKRLWGRQIAATGSTVCNPKTSMAGPTPVTDGRHVYVLFATGDLAALDHDGNLLWYRSLARDYPDITNQVGMAASPVLADDTLLLPLENAGDSFALAVDARTGKNRWKAERHRDINWVTPLVVHTGGRADVLFQTAKEITAYDPRTGQVRWTYAGDGLSQVPSPLAGDGGLIFVAGREYAALRPGPDGTTPEVVWKTNRIRPGYSTPVVAGGRVYGLTGVNVTCVNAKDGELVWQQRLKGPFSASPVIGDGKLYAVNEQGLTSVVALGDKPKVLATNALDETILATPAISGGAIFIRSDKHLWCIGK